MPRNGSGQFSLVNNSWNPAVNGVNATAADWQTLADDIASALTASVAKDGQTTLTGNLQMGGNQITGLAAPTGQGQALRWEQLTKGTDIASAATISIPNEGAIFDVTGTTGINAFGSSFPGRIIWLRFTGSVLLTNSASLLLPAASNMVGAYGDVLPFVCTEPGVWKCPLAAFDHGQCQFRYVSATECRLFPYNGNGLIINGRQYRIPLAGVPITTTGLSGNSSYYVYAKDDGSGGLALETQTASSILHSTAPNGVEIRTGDASRTLVGWVGTNAAPSFLDNTSNRRVASWFNRRRKSVTETISNAATTSTTPANAGSGSAIFCWADEIYAAEGDCSSINSGAAATNNWRILRNGSVWSGLGAGTAPFAGGWVSSGISIADQTPSADSLLQFLAQTWVTAGTGTFTFTYLVEANI